MGHDGVTKGKEFLSKSFDSNEWVYPGLVPHGCVTLLIGTPCSNSAEFAYGMMLLYLCGKPFLGEYMPQSISQSARKGLIINSAKHPSDVQSMLRSMPDLYNDLADFDVIECGWNLSQTIELERIICRSNYTFIVIDSYQSIHSHVYEWSETAPDSGLGASELQRIAKTYGVTILLLHHLKDIPRKDRRVPSGRNRIIKSVGYVMSIKERGAIANVSKILEVGKPMSSRKTRVAIAFDKTMNQYNICMSGDGERLNKISRMCAKILPEFCHPSEPRLGVDYIMDKFGNRDEDRMIVNEAICKLESRGVVTFDQSSSTYSLTVHNDAMSGYFAALEESQDGIRELVV